MICDLITGYILTREGSAVSEQFESTFENGDDFDQQNDNALKYVLAHCKTVQKAEVFSDDSDLINYIGALENYLKGK